MGVNHVPKQTITVIVRPELERDDVHSLADDLVHQLSTGVVAEVLVDVSRIDTPDVVYLDALARLQLTARRHGSTIRVVDPCPDLVDLLGVAGLSDIIPVRVGDSQVVDPDQRDTRQDQCATGKLDNGRQFVKQEPGDEDGEQHLGQADE